MCFAGVPLLFTLTGSRIFNEPWLVALFSASSAVWSYSTALGGDGGGATAIRLHESRGLEPMVSALYLDLSRGQYP